MRKHELEGVALQTENGIAYQLEIDRTRNILALAPSYLHAYVHVSRSLAFANNYSKSSLHRYY